MRKLLSIILISLLYFTSANAQRYLETQIIYPDSGGVLGSVHYVYNDASLNYQFVTTINDAMNTWDTTIYGADITGIDSIIYFYNTFVIDTVTNDTVAMAHYNTGNYIDDLLIPFYTCNIDFNSVYSTSASYLCNGTCNAEVNTSYDSTITSDTISYYMFFNIDDINNTYDSVWVSDFNLSSLCEGKYSLGIYINQNIVYSTTFYIDAEISTPANYTVNVLTYSSSTQTNCDGSAKAIINDGVAPYTYSWDNDLYISNDSIGNLCVGLHTLSVIDANSDSVAINFGIADSSSTFNNANNTGTTPNDTLFYLIENCDINYNQTVDSAFVSNFTTVDSTTFILECEIWQSGNVTQTLDTLVFSTQGVNYLEILFYCDANKSTTSLIKITDFINIENATMVSKIVENNIKLYPNPSNGKFTINGENINNIIVTDINGRIIKSINVNSNSININLSDKQKGIYFIKIDSNKNFIVRKIIIN